MRHSFCDPRFNWFKTARIQAELLKMRQISYFSQISTFAKKIVTLLHKLRWF